MNNGELTITVHHLKSGAFAAEVPTNEGTVVVFSTPYDMDPGHSDQYDILTEVLKRSFGMNLPPISKTRLLDPGLEEVTVTGDVGGCT